MKKERFTSYIKRVGGYLYYREYIHTKENLSQRIESNKFQKQQKKRLNQ